MTAHYADLDPVLPESRRASPAQRVVLHVEPDFWGYMRAAISGDAAATRGRRRCRRPGIAALQGLPSNVAGFAQRDREAAKHATPRTSRSRITSASGAPTSTSRSRIRPMPPSTRSPSARRTFYRSLSANFDLVVRRHSADRDARVQAVIVYGDGGISWWDAADFRRSARFLGKLFSTTAAQAAGDVAAPARQHAHARRRTTSWGHYQDNRVEWLLDEAARTHLDDLSRRRASSRSSSAAAPAA